MNLGIIGLGSQGKQHLRNSLFLKEFKVVGVADTSKHALEFAIESGVKSTYLNYEDLLRDSNIDAVIINLPNYLHMESTIKAAEAGKDILLEKPLAGRLDEGKKIVSSVKQNGVKLMLGYSLRFDSLFRSLRERIHDGYFGEVEIAVATNISNGPFTARADRVGPVPVPNWWFDKELVQGGALLDLGIHMVDLLTWYFGEVESVSCYLGYTLNMSVEDAATCIIKFKKGPLAVVNAGWFSKDHVHSISLNGTSRIFSTVVSKTSLFRFVWNDFKSIIGRSAASPIAEELKYFADCIKPRCCTFSFCARRSFRFTDSFYGIRALFYLKSDKNVGLVVVELNSVSFVKTEDLSADGIRESISKSISLLNFDYSKKVDKIVIKPNMCYYYHPSTGEVTDPLFVGALIDVLRMNFQSNPEIFIVESDASAMKCRHIFKMLRYDVLAREKNVRLVNLCEEKSKQVEMEIAGHSLKFDIPELMLNCDFIVNVPKIKYMSGVKITCAMKNMFGCNAVQKKSIVPQNS